MSTTAIRVSDLRKTYSGSWGKEGVTALKGINLEVQQGEVFGLLGPNGAGKTTLVKILLGLVHPTSGEGFLFDKPISHSEAREMVGYLPEQHRFPSHFTAGTVLDVYGRLSKVPSEQRKERIPVLLERVNLQKQRDAKVGTFSKGMRQRLGLAQALLGDPDLLFLDEPTDGVDPVGRRTIRDLLAELQKEGRTIFLNSHLLSEVEQMCTRIAIMREGRLIREGPVQQLTAVEKTYDLVCTPIPYDIIERLDDAIEEIDHKPAANLPPELKQYRLLVKDRSHLNDVLQHLLQHDVVIDMLNPFRRTLEDYFIEVLDESDRTPEQTGEAN